MQEILYKSHYKEEYGNRQTYNGKYSKKGKTSGSFSRTFIPEKRNESWNKLGEPFTRLGKHTKNRCDDIHGGAPLIYLSLFGFNSELR